MSKPAGSSFYWHATNNHPLPYVLVSLVVTGDSHLSYIRVKRCSSVPLKSIVLWQKTSGFLLPTLSIYSPRGGEHYVQSKKQRPLWWGKRFSFSL
jgi:hypothetical protein